MYDDEYYETLSEDNDLRANFGDLGFVELFLNHSRYDDPNVTTMTVRFDTAMILNGWDRVFNV